MSVEDLIREFDVRKDVPIDVNDVKSALIARGVRDTIWFWAVDIDAEILRGQLVHWKQKGDPQPAIRGADDYKGVADIYYAESLTSDWRRLVCCKELLHILDPEGALAALPEAITRLTEKIVLPPDLQSSPDDGWATLNDRVAMLKATAILFPWRARELILKDGKLSQSEIAKLMGLPARYVALVMNEVWGEIHDIFVR